MRCFVISFLFLLNACLYSQKIGCQYDLFPAFNKETKLFGFKDLFGNWRIQSFYNEVRTFNEGVCVVKKKGKFGLINCNAKVIIPLQYEEIKDFVNGYCWVKKKLRK